MRTYSLRQSPCDKGTAKSSFYHMMDQMSCGHWHRLTDWLQRVGNPSAFNSSSNLHQSESSCSQIGWPFLEVAWVWGFCTLNLQVITTFSISPRETAITCQLRIFLITLVWLSPYWGHTMRGMRVITFYPIPRFFTIRVTPCWPLKNASLKHLLQFFKFRSYLHLLYISHRT